MRVYNNLNFDTKVGKQWFKRGENEVNKDLEEHPDLLAFINKKQFTLLDKVHTDSLDIKSSGSETSATKSAKKKTTKKPKKDTAKAEQAEPEAQVEPKVEE